jgi:hypothetical protein
MLYRPHWATVGLLVSIAGGAGLMLLALASTATSQDEKPVAARVVVVLAGLALLSLAIRSARAGIHVGPISVTVRGWFRDTKVAWSDIRRFGVATAHFAHGVYVERLDGTRVRCGLFSDGPEVHLLGAAQYNEEVVQALEDVRRALR